MAKLTKEQAKQHQKAARLVALDRELTWTEREFVLDNWQEAGTATHNLDGAFFTPEGLAHDLALHVFEDCARIIDLCAGIGRLAYHARHYAGRRLNGVDQPEIVCVERNPQYVAVGRKVLPEARWICADILDLPDGLGTFDYAISNPPFGPITRTGNALPYQGRAFEFHVITVASRLADRGVFIIPQVSAPFRTSSDLEAQHSAEYSRFERQTGIRLGTNIGIDASAYLDDWNGVSPLVEIVTADFSRVAEAQGPWCVGSFPARVRAAAGPVAVPAARRLAPASVPAPRPAVEQRPAVPAAAVAATLF